MKRSLYNVENEKVEFTSMKEVLFVPFRICTIPYNSIHVYISMNNEWREDGNSLKIQKYHSIPDINIRG